MSTNPTASSTAVRVQRDMTHRDYGREEYIADCVRRAMEGENVLITLGGYWSASALPLVLQQKFGSSGGVFFPGFIGAVDEVVSKIRALGAEVRITEFRGGSNSDMFGSLCDSSRNLDGHCIKVLKTK